MLSKDDIDDLIRRVGNVRDDLTELYGDLPDGDEIDELPDEIRDEVDESNGDAQQYIDEASNALELVQRYLGQIKQKLPA